MTLALADSHAFWSVAIGIGAVVIVVVILLMLLLLSFLRDIAASVTRLLEVGGEVAENTAAIGGLADTGAVLDMILAEALVHDGYLAGRL
jgi:hypothetical protein